MAQKSLHWNGASIGDADALTVNAADGIGFRLANVDYESPFVDIGLRMLFNGDENRGVLKGWLNELVVAGVGTPITVGTGGAIVYGMPYENTTVAVNVAVPAPTTDTRQDTIVLRRDWNAQTIRITRIAGVEGGSPPAITQSPAPTGTGIYDVPLATISVTTGGVITVTDTREYCLFGGVPGDDSMGTTQLTNSSIDWADRETRTTRMFLGGGCLQPMNAGSFWYNYTSNVITTAAPTWNGAANTEAWQLNAPTYEGVIGRLALPFPDYATGDITSYVWWTANAALASTFYMRCAAQFHATTGDGYYYGMGSPSSVYVSETTVQHQFYRTAGLTIADSWTFVDLDPTAVPTDVEYLAYWYNSAGAEDINILGVEFVYEGYV